MNEDTEKDIKNYKKLILSLQKQLRQKDIIIRTLTEALDKTEENEEDLSEFDFSKKSCIQDNLNIINPTTPSPHKSNTNSNVALKNQEDSNIVNSAKQELICGDSTNIQRREYQIIENKEIDFSKGFRNFQPSLPFNQTEERMPKKVRYKKDYILSNISEREENKTTEFNEPEISISLDEDCYEKKMENLLKKDKPMDNNQSQTIKDVINEAPHKNAHIDPVMVNNRTYNLNNNETDYKNVVLNSSSYYGDLFIVLKQKNFFLKILTTFCNHNRNLIGAHNKQIDSTKIIEDMLRLKFTDMSISYVNTNKTGVYKYFLRNLSKLEFEDIISFYLLYSRNSSLIEKRTLLVDFILYTTNKDYYIFILLIVMGSNSLYKQTAFTFKMLNCLLYNEIKEINVIKFFKIEVPGRNFSLMSLINLIKDIHKPIINKDPLSYLTEIISNIENKGFCGLKYTEHLEEIRTCFLLASSYLGFEIVYNKILKPFIIPGIKESNITPYYFIGNFLIIFDNNPDFKESDISKELYGYMQGGLEDLKTKNICMKMLNLMGVYY